MKLLTGTSGKFPYLHGKARAFAELQMVSAWAAEQERERKIVARRRKRLVQAQKEADHCMIRQA